MTHQVSDTSDSDTSDAAGGTARTAEADEPVIVNATLTAGHDGEAEAVIDIRYPNGAVRSLTFTCEALTQTLDSHGITSLDELRGRPWTVLIEMPVIGQNLP